MTHNITALPGYILSDYIINQQGLYYDCKIIAINTYASWVPTFTVIIDNQYIYSDLPPTSFIFNSHSSEKFTLNELVYCNCPGDYAEVVEYEYLKHRNIATYVGNEWTNGEYLWTIEFNNHNELLHGIKLSNGQIAMMPNNRITLGSQILPSLKRNKEIWKI